MNNSAFKESIIKISRLKAIEKLVEDEKQETEILFVLKVRFIFKRKQCCISKAHSSQR